LASFLGLSGIFQEPQEFPRTRIFLRILRILGIAGIFLSQSTVILLYLPI
jgi:hypothetical protein